MWNRIAEAISRATGEEFSLGNRRPVSGGSINETWTVSDGARGYFVKLNSHRHLDMFEAEQAGLEALAATGTIRVPRPICLGVHGERAFLVLEGLSLGGPADWTRMGEQLAGLHRVGSARGFGWHRNNTIGTTPQPNPWTADWAEFFARHRLGHQLALARDRGIDSDRGRRLLERLPTLLDHSPEPVLLHGDLWGGNAAFTAEGEPVVFDPAVYYGDRETDLAMSELFGGFPTTFYASYRRVYPLEAGYEQRREIYNLYHILNHANLFGGGYSARANRMMEQILRR